VNEISFHYARTVFTVVAVAAIVALFIVLVVVPQMDGITAVRGQIEETRRKTSEIVVEVKSYEQSFSELNRIGDSREAIAGMFPQREDMVTAVEALERSVARAGGAHILSITDLKEQVAESRDRSIDSKPIEPLLAGLTALEEVPFTVEVAGGYRSLADFFLGLENSGFTVLIDKINITAEAKQNPDGILLNTGIGIGRFDGVFFVRSQTP